MAVFAAVDESAEIPVSITLGGTLPAEAETFAVEMTPVDEANPMPAGTIDGVFTLNLKGDTAAVRELKGSIAIDFDALGVYEYTISQAAGTNADCLYDEAVYHVTVFVTNAEQGGYDVTVAVRRDGEEEKTEITFENVYANPDEVTITAVKTLDGKTPKDGAFTFELLDSKGKVVDTAKNDGQTVTFDALSYYKAGTYEYTLKEVKGSEKNIVYDKTVYDVIVEVVKDGDYYAELHYELNGKVLEGTPVFANKTQTTSPDTGEGNLIYIMGGVMAVSAIAIVVLLLAMKRRKTEGAE